ncbi:hypothetical protein GF319_15060 [Candidatus Bathyarchaeota archaeon]|nr:hypothetical protein [Candidatus Bathyarchaeota archaeon]
MFNFKAHQKIFDIGDVKIGGLPGVNPTVMIGSIFYKNDPLITSKKRGSFDRDAAHDLINDVEEISRKTGLPFMLDVVCSVDEAVEDYLAWAADSTNAPILLDAVSNEAALRGLEYVEEQKLLERTVFNSLNKATPETIYDKIKEVGLESAIILTYSNTAVTSSSQRVELLRPLIKKAESVGISKPLVDTFVMDVPTLGLASKALQIVKDKYGLPVGYGAHNAIGSWTTLKKQGNQIIGTACATIVNALPAVLGADFIIYGPLKSASYIFPAVSVVDTAFGQLVIEEGGKLDTLHPRFKLSASIGKNEYLTDNEKIQDEIDEIRFAIKTHNSVNARTATERAITKGISPVTVIEEGITRELRRIGEAYERGGIWFTDLVSAAETVRAAMEIIEPEIETRDERIKSLGTYLIGTVHGDIHDIGKNIVTMLLRANGFRVIDLGVNVSTSEFVEAVREHEPDILGMSALLTTTLKELRKVVEALEREGLRDKVKIIIGGAATSSELADELSVDAYAENALDGVKIAIELMEKSNESYSTSDP